MMMMMDMNKHLYTAPMIVNKQKNPKKDSLSSLFGKIRRQANSVSIQKPNNAPNENNKQKKNAFLLVTES